MYTYIISLKFNAVDDLAATDLAEKVAAKVKSISDRSAATTGTEGLYENAQIAISKVQEAPEVADE